MNTYPPLEYSGPYPVHQLNRARDTLIFEIEREFRTSLRKIKPKLGFGVPYYEKYRNKDPTGNWYAIRYDLKKAITEQNGRGKADGMVQPEPSRSTWNNTSQQNEDAHGKQSMTRKRKSNLDGLDTEPNVKKQKREFQKVETNTKLDEKRRGSAADRLIEELSSKNHSKNKLEYFCYKCDFCSFNAPSSEEAEKHLEEACHFSASLYKGQKAPSDGHQSNFNRKKDPALISVAKRLAVTNENARGVTLVAVCPECNDVFDDIFMCSYHYQDVHPDKVQANNAIEGCYTICPILKVQSLRLKRLQCTKCNVLFSKQKKLIQHWEQMDHFPYKTSNEGTVLLFSCSYCNKSYDDFVTCLSHIHPCKGNAATTTTQGPHSLKNYFEMTVKFILHPRRTEILKLLPPFHQLDQMTEKELLEEKDFIHYMQKCLKKTHSPTKVHLVRRLQSIQTWHKRSKNRLVRSF